jgi:hypothetical protein
MYIGRQPIIGNFVKLDAITTSATTTFNLLNGGVAYYPQSANNCLVSLNGILQAPTDSYTISGSTIIFSSALTTSDVIDFIIVLGDVLNIGTPSDNTVTAAKIVDGTITANKLATGVGGKVLQVIQTVNSTERSTTSTSFVDVTGMSVSITPSSSSNKVLILCNFNAESSSGDASSNYTILRNSTALHTSSFFNTLYVSGLISAPCSICFLDSPATTSSTTYKLQFKRSNGTGGTTKVLAFDSTITVLEIAG